MHGSRQTWAIAPPLPAVRSRSIEREHLHVDATCIHLGDALVANLLKLLINALAAHARWTYLLGELLAGAR